MLKFLFPSPRWLSSALLFRWCYGFCANNPAFSWRQDAGGTYFPQISKTDFQVIKTEDAEGIEPYRFYIYGRIKMEEQCRPDSLTCE
jgi:hypothetical protein